MSGDSILVSGDSILALGEWILVPGDLILLSGAATVPLGTMWSVLRHLTSIRSQILRFLDLSISVFLDLRSQYLVSQLSVSRIPYLVSHLDMI